ncbi:hypothetical protein LCGC14_0469860 [marine sediment metagenome]|uniref:Uncharacterized protein n=1 Tax=marine sediment metagenome TaxID=412755 RepID=A0A0F9UZE4_9ZZZZ
MQPDLTYGDIVTCKIRGNTIVQVTESFDAKLQFEIIGYSFTDNFYILHIPKYYNIRNSWIIERDHLDDLFIKRRFLGKMAAAIKRDKIIKAIRKDSNQDGMNCSKCKKFHHMAEANQSDGTLVCWSCRNKPY